MDLLAFAATALLLELTPGPNMVWLVLLTALHGRRAGFAAVGGVALGLLLPGLVAAFGMAQLAAQSPALLVALRWTGVAYLLWLAWQNWPRGANEPVALPTEDKRLLRHVRDGLFVNLFNIKSALFFLLALPEFARPDRPLFPQTLALTILYVAIATGVHLALVGLAGRAHALLKNAARARALRRAGAIMIALIALWLAVK
jgi:threonine/homoserine/homoserine lactone efflux protein